MTEAGYDNGLSNYECNEEDERENLFFVSLKRQTERMFEMTAGQNKEITSQKFTKCAVRLQLIPPLQGILQVLKVYLI